MRSVRVVFECDSVVWLMAHIVQLWWGWCVSSERSWSGGCKSVIWLCVAEMLFSLREKTAALAVKVGNSSERLSSAGNKSVSVVLQRVWNRAEQPGSRQKPNNNTALRWLCMCMCECIWVGMCEGVCDYMFVCFGGHVWALWSVTRRERVKPTELLQKQEERAFQCVLLRWCAGEGAGPEGQQTNQEAAFLDSVTNTNCYFVCSRGSRDGERSVSVLQQKLQKSVSFTWNLEINWGNKSLNMLRCNDVSAPIAK